MSAISLGDGEVILAIRPTPIRRGVALAAMVGMAGLLVVAGVTEAQQAAIWRALLVILGVGSATLAWRFYKSTDVCLELTREELRQTGGQVLFKIKDVARVDRGAFSMKPSNGLNVILNRPYPTAWVPGLWWRWGQRVGIGGVTAPAQARALADTITLILAEEEGQDVPPSLI